MLRRPYATVARKPTAFQHFILRSSKRATMTRVGMQKVRLPPHRRRLPADVLGLLQADVASVLELDILVFMADDPQRTWRVKEVAHILSADERTVAQSLMRLCERGVLITRTRGDVVWYAFGPSGMRLSQTVQRLARLYASDRRLVLEALTDALISGPTRWVKHCGDGGK